MSSTASHIWTIGRVVKEGSICRLKEEETQVIYCRPFHVARLSLPSHFLQYSNICMKFGTGTEFASNVTSLIMTEACEVSRCQAARGKVARLLLHE